MEYDVVVVGAGPGGYVAAIRMAQLGKRVALVERDRIGGVCLNWGCIPTKALCQAAKQLERIRTAEVMGIHVDGLRIDRGELATWKGRVVETLVSGIGQVLKENGVFTIHDEAIGLAPGSVTLGTRQRISCSHIVIATGSSPIQIPGLPFTSPSVWTSRDALSLEEIPSTLLVVGAGVIGLELATIYNRLGSDVIILEMAKEILPTMDLGRRVRTQLQRAIQGEGIALRLGDAAADLEEGVDGCRVMTRGGETIAADRVLVAVGRRPNSRELPIRDAGIDLDERGFVKVSETLQTSQDGIYAIGDLVPGPQLAHKASAEGIFVAEHLNQARQTPPHGIDYETIPQAVFTDPELATVGLSEPSARAQGLEVRVGRFPYAAVGKAVAMEETTGLFEIVAEASSGRLVGCQILGAEASTLIAVVAVAVQYGMTIEALAESIQAHPTLPEGIKEAAEAALGRAIHAMNR
ncbi:dihydrolipoyl dehydrogenase [Candidatus Bipolaricaulota bacterium]|nr:dihydrolipoyl dehydrogenase [Candidatus Bipolaricaulota bacterium]